MKCGSASAVITAVVACVAYAVLRGGQQQPASDGDYELGSGKMFDSIAPRYDLINKVRRSVWCMCYRQ